MDLTTFENFNTHRISLNEAKRILYKNGNEHTDEEIKKIIDECVGRAGSSASGKSK